MSAPPLQFSSPMQPVAPPSKKMKAGSEKKEPLSIDGDENISRRRQELQRLKDKQQMRTSERRVPSGLAAAAPASRTEGLLAQARTKLGGPPTSGPPGSRPAAPPRDRPAAPPGGPISRVHHSDIFPSVEPKVAARASAEPSRFHTRPPPSRPSSAVPPPPMTKNQNDGGVARRLDPSFALGRISPATGSQSTDRAPGAPNSEGMSPSLPGARATSAPPSRPPPPPGPPPPVKEAPETTTATATTTSSSTTTTTRSRGYASRPPPMTPASTKKPPATPIPEPVETPKLVREPREPTPAPAPAAVPLSTPAPTPVPATKRVAATPPTTASYSVKTPSGDAAVATAAAGSISGAPSTNAGGAPPTTSRKELIRNLHQYADTPAKPATAQEIPKSEESGLLRLEKEMHKHEKAKAEALRKVAILEAQLQKLKEKGDPEEELGALVRMAEREGEGAALQWARQKISGTTPRGPKQVGFFSPQSPGLTSPRPNVRKRVSTPHPKKKETNGGMENVMETEKLYRDAVKYAPFEFVSTTDVATFLVRRPYGNVMDKELWFTAGYAPSKQYEKNADVKAPSTLEIVAQIHADGSMLSLHGEAFVRHLGSDEDADWVEFGNYDDLDKPLGSVTFIDSDANEKDYSLDDVLGEALTTRVNYCTTVVSMVEALKSQRLTAPTGPTGSGVFNPAAASPAKSQTSEIGVGTEDLPYNEGTDTGTNARGNTGNSNDGDNGPEKKTPSPSPHEEEDDGSDFVSLSFQWFVSSLLWIIWTILVTIPTKVISFTIMSLIAIILISMLWLQFVDDHGAAGMGASIDFMYNRYGIV